MGGEGRGDVEKREGGDGGEEMGSSQEGEGDDRGREENTGLIPKCTPLILMVNLCTPIKQELHTPIMPPM